MQLIVTTDHGGGTKEETNLSTPASLTTFVVMSGVGVAEGCEAQGYVRTLDIGAVCVDLLGVQPADPWIADSSALLTPACG